VDFVERWTSQGRELLLMALVVAIANSTAP